MARLKIPSRAPSVTVLLVAAVVLATAGPAIASKPEPRTTLTRVPPLLDCVLAPAGPPAGQSDGFRANVLSLLHDIPSIAAATPTGFAAALSGRTRRDRAFARARCFGGANSSSSSGSCRACLTAAARDATDGCGASRRAGVWRAGCFLSYADTEALSAREEQFRGWFYAADPDTTAAAARLKDGLCFGEQDYCDRCFDDTVRAAVKLPWLVRMRREVIVVGYSCYLRVESYVLPNDITDARRSFLSFMLVITMIAQTAIVAPLLLLVVLTLRDQDDLP